MGKSALRGGGQGQGGFPRLFGGPSGITGGGSRQTPPAYSRPDRGGYARPNRSQYADPTGRPPAQPVRPAPDMGRSRGPAPSNPRGGMGRQMMQSRMLRGREMR